MYYLVAVERWPYNKWACHGVVLVSVREYTTTTTVYCAVYACGIRCKIETCKGYGGVSESAWAFSEQASEIGAQAEAWPRCRDHEGEVTQDIYYAGSSTTPCL